MDHIVKKIVLKIFLYVSSLCVTVLTGFPFIFILINSFKDMQEYLTNIWSLPSKLFFGNFEKVLKPSFMRYFLNSFIVSVSGVLIIVIVSSLISYSFAKMNYRSKNLLYYIIIAGMMIPVHTTLIPTFTLLSKTGLTNSLVGLLGPYVSYNIPISVFILTQFFKEIPKEIEEAAIIDGCGVFGIYRKIIMPLSGPAISTIVVYTFLNIWNEFINANVLINDSAKKTLPLGIREFYGYQSINIPAILTAILIGSLPIIIIYFCAQEKVVNGLTKGAVKA